jgi:hypothetical protein
MFTTFRLQCALHSIFSCRIVLNLRNVVRRRCLTDLSTFGLHTGYREMWLAGVDLETGSDLHDNNDGDEDVVSGIGLDELLREPVARPL